MDQKKTGQFLKKLRNEKGLTQEQLAKRFNVSNRSVSRWETGSNLPDISLLVEIADFYDVDVREIIDGERKSEMMDKEIREVAGKMADYSNNETKGHLLWVQIAGIAGIVLSLAALVLQGLTYQPDLKRFFAIVMTFAVLGIMSIITLYVTGVLQKIMAHKKLMSAIKITVFVLIGCGLCWVITTAFAIGMFYLSFNSSKVEVSELPESFAKYIHVSDPDSEYSYGNMPEFDVLPQSLEGLNIKEYQLTYYNPWDPQYLVYFTVDYDEQDYAAEIDRLSKIGVEDEYVNYYSVTGEPEGYDLVAMDCSEYYGFIYAMVPEGDNTSHEITYVAIWFCNYAPDLDVHDYIPGKYLLKGLDVSDDNPYRSSRL